ncbi:protein MAIN-LIKE 1-like [Vicia villosa]|uniref:protein MAIN-LIKE 1-like n=1 Tax=Vicia villosa TaxID=3911 RepID=UPI00273B1AA3|nr:protein MAIN-LIKE 1-like [Vicia villosa]
MTVTLDDVHALFHLPIAGTFFTPVHRDQTTVVHALEVDELTVLKEFGDTRRFHLRMSWLRKVYQQLVDAERYKVAARAYMLHLVALAALTILYTALNAASRPDTRHLAGYLSLLQCWIYEHFPCICERRTQGCAAADPCTMRWKARQTLPGETPLMEYRWRLDALMMDDVIWTPYTSHRSHHPSDVSSLYSGYVRWESHVAMHLPEWCLRQFGYIQGIPRPVSEALTGGIDRWFQSHILSPP